MKLVKALLTLAFVASLTACFGLVGCSLDGTHTHSCDEWEQVSPATCTEDGLERGVCKGCGEELTRIIPALGHNYDEWEFTEEDMHTRVCLNDPTHVETAHCDFEETVVPATCDEAGRIDYVCKDCGHEHSVEGQPALGHSYGKWEQVIVESEEEEHTHYHIHVCAHDPEHVEKVECTLVEKEKVLPTCTSAGYTLLECEECGAIHEADPVPALSHSYGEEYHADGEDCYRLCSECGNKEVLPHDWTVNIVEATCTDPGEVTRTCSRCHEERVDSTTEALGHVYPDTYEHYVEDGADMHKRVCTRGECGHVESEACEFVDHENFPATCVTPSVDSDICKKCLFVKDADEQPALGHSWVYTFNEETHDHTRKCSVCEEEETEPCSFTDTHTAPTCENNETVLHYCPVCEGSYREELQDTALGHSWNDWAISDKVHSRVCSRNPEHVQSGIHNYGEDNICDDCNHDGLTYKLSGAHYIVENDNNVPNAVYITISESIDGCPVEEIGRGAFTNNRKIETVVLPSSLKVIDEMAFYYCQNLYEVTINGDGGSLVTIGNHAFAYCYTLATAELPDGLVTIGDSAFDRCANLSLITVPDTVEKIGKYAFAYTAFSANPENWDEDGAFYINNHLIFLDEGYEGSYEIKDETVSVAADAFENCTALTEVIIPVSVKLFDLDAFEGCINLENVIYRGALSDWLAITFTNDAASPMHYAQSLNLEGAEGFIDIPEGVTRIPAGTFRNTAITGVKVPATVTNIGAHAFDGCASLETIDLPDTLAFVGEDAFKGTAYALNPEHWEGGLLYVGCVLAEANLDEIGTEVIVRDGVRVIAPKTFQGSAIARVTLPAELVYIGDYAFDGCSSLTTAIFKDTTKDWFCHSYRLGIWRQLSTYNTASVASYLSVYNGDWKRVG